MSLRARTLGGCAAAALIIVALALTPLAAARARRARLSPGTPVPQGFVGVDVDGPLTVDGSQIDFAQQVATMVASGVQSIRVAFDWARIEPYASWADVPAADSAQFTNVGGRPFDFQTTDTIVGDAARAGISVLPTALYAPAWDAVDNPDGVAYPLRDAPFGTYLTALISRYGLHGSFWAANPGIHRMPIRSWQIWNEPDLAYYWHQPFVNGYIALLRVAHAAIKRADPEASVVLGALTNLAWRSLGRLYRVPGARRLFDAVAVNGFTRLPSNVLLYLRFMRDAMDRFGDRTKPLIATEVSWPSARGQTDSTYDFITTRAGQARNIAALLPQLARQRTSLGLASFDYYTWMGQEDPGTQAFNFAGLLGVRDGAITVKPALAAFRAAALRLERCRRKGATATRCIH